MEVLIVLDCLRRGGDGEAGPKGLREGAPVVKGVEEVLVQEMSLVLEGGHDLIYGRAVFPGLPLDDLDGVNKDSKEDVLGSDEVVLPVLRPKPRRGLNGVNDGYHLNVFGAGGAEGAHVGVLRVLHQERISEKLHVVALPERLSKVDPHHVGNLAWAEEANAVRGVAGFFLLGPADIVDKGRLVPITGSA